MENFGAGLIAMLVSGFFNAAFPLPLKYAKKWKWENTWLLFSILTFWVLPLAVAHFFNPDLCGIFANTPLSTFAPAAIFGFIWGIAQVTFGLSFPLVGMAMSFAIVVGLCGVLGSFIPMAVFHRDQLFGVRGAALLVSTLILIVGLRLYTQAARQREADSNPAGKPEDRSNYRLGLFLCVFTGVLGSALNLGFALSDALTNRLTSAGSTPLAASFAVWAVVLVGGSTPNLIYSIYLLVKNRTFSCFGQGAGRESMLALAMSVLWLAGTLGYGVGATFMGSYGTSIGYAIYVTILILASTIMGVMTGEWKSAKPATYGKMKLALAVILVAVLILSSTGLL